MITSILLLIGTLFLSPSLGAVSDISEHCERITLEKLRVNRTAGRSGDHVVSDGKGVIVRFRTRPAALYAYTKMKDLNLALVCYEDKATRDFTFFLTDNGTKPHARDNANDLCQKFTLPLEILEQRRLFRRFYVIAVPGTGRNAATTFGEFESSAAATKVVEAIEKFGFDSFCQDRSRANGFSWFGDSTL